MCQKNKSFVVFIVLLCTLLSFSAVMANAEDDILMFIGPIMASTKKVSFLHANMKGVSQIYALNTAVEAVASKQGYGDILQYKIQGKTFAKGASVGTSNLVSLKADGSSAIALTSSLGSVQAFYTVIDPSARFVYVALDYTDPDTLLCINTIHTGLIRIDLSNNDVEVVAPGYVAAPISESYYANMRLGKKPIQFDGNGNVVFNGYDLVNGSVTGKSRLRRVTLPAKTVSTLTDDSQTVQFFIALDNGEVVFQSTSTLSETRLWLWKPSAGFIDLSNGPVDYLLRDDSQGFLFKETGGGNISFSRSKIGGGVDMAKLPNTTTWSVLGDDGSFYGVDTDTAGNVKVSTILPYAQSPFQTVAMGSQVTNFPWQTKPVQMSKGYLYFVASINPGDGFGSRDTINAQRLRQSDRVSILADRRFELYAWRQTGDYDKLYFTARDKAASEATIYSGIIDTVNLQAGLPESQYLTLTPVASAVGAAAEVTDMEILTPKAPETDPGFDPVIQDYATSLFAEGVFFSKYMDKQSVESGLQFKVRSGSEIAYLPVWFLQSLYLIPDLSASGLGDNTTLPLDNATCYTLSVPDTAKDLWNWPIADSMKPLATTVTDVCNAPQCSYTVDQSSLTFESSGGVQSVGVTANLSTCAWVTQNPATAWLSVTSGGTGSGTATVTVQANTFDQPRTATINVAGKEVVVTQREYNPPCAFTVEPMTLSVAATGGEQTLTVTVSPSGCVGGSWTVDNTLGWVSIISGASGYGNGTVRLVVAANTGIARSDTIRVAGKAITISQLQREPGIFNSAGVAMDISGNVYATDIDGCHIVKFSSSGKFLTKWGSCGRAAGQFIGPSGIAIDSEGNVFVADTSNNCIQKFSSSGEFLAKWGSSSGGEWQFSGPNGIAVDKNDNVYVADTMNCRIQKFSSSGVFLGMFGEWGGFNGQFQNPYGVAVDSNGYIYVADTENMIVQKFSSSFKFVSSWGGWGTENGKFQYPRGIAVDKNDDIWVVDQRDHSVQKFSSNGDFRIKWGTYGSKDGQLAEPWFVAVDSTNNIYVTEQVKKCIQKFSSDGTFIEKW